MLIKMQKYTNTQIIHIQKHEYEHAHVLKMQTQ